MIKLCLGGLTHTQCTNKQTEEFKRHFAEMAHRQAYNLGYTHTHKRWWICPDISFLPDTIYVWQSSLHIFNFRDTQTYTSTFCSAQCPFEPQRHHQVNDWLPYKKNLQYLCCWLFHISQCCLERQPAWPADMSCSPHFSLSPFLGCRYRMFRWRSRVCYQFTGTKAITENTHLHTETRKTPTRLHKRVWLRINVLK